MKKRKVMLIYFAKFQILAQLRTELEIRNHHSTTNIMKGPLWTSTHQLTIH